MAEHKANALPSRHHETRLALVMNGGVSLAVWMGGVTHELDLLRRASSGLEDERSVVEADRPVFRIWQELARKAGTRVSVDIVSGTSAGGLNGLLLATALARGTALPPLREVWEESAALDKLLTPPSRTSLLSGQSFEEKIGEALNRIGECPSCPQQSVTLFVTATALDGRNHKYRDSFEADFDVRDHRRIYRFRQGESVVYEKKDCETWDIRPRPCKDFVKANDRKLITAARATASFPGAFPPVNESELMEFRRWPRETVGFPASCVMDGGVLNNEPFGPVLDAITRRKIENPVRRVLVYVVPSAGRIELESTRRQACDEIQWYTVAPSARRYPGESNFRSSAEEMANRLSGSIKDRPLELFGRMAKDQKLARNVRKVARRLLHEYRLNRARAVLFDVRRRIAEAGAVNCLSVTPEADPKWIEDMLGAGRARDSGWKHPNWVPRNESREISGPRQGGWRWGLSGAERVLQLLTEHLHQPSLSDSSLELPTPDGAQRATHRLEYDQRNRLIEGAQRVSGLLRDVLAVRDAVDAELWRRASSEEIADEGAAILYQQVFDDLSVPVKVESLVREAAEVHRQALEDAVGRVPWKNKMEVIADCLAVEVVTRAYAPPSKVVESTAPAFEFLRLGPDKISPLFDEDRYDDLGDRKLYGIRFQHFGAFIHPGWRKSDFAWGRLDAAHHLLYLFPQLTDQERRQHEVRIHKAILEAEAPRGDCVSEGAARQWMERNLQELRKSDFELLKDLRRRRPKQFRKTLKGVVGALMELLDGSGQPTERHPTPLWMRLWDPLVGFGRCVFYRPEDWKQLTAQKSWKELKGRKKLTLRGVRRLTFLVRRRGWKAYRRDPTKLHKAVTSALKWNIGAIVFCIAIVGAALGFFIPRLFHL